jgi:hypothetical protein
LLFTAAAYGYSVLTHEAIVDSVCDTQIRKLLLQRFPGATAEDVKQGPLKVLALRMPTPEVETMFMASFNTTLDRYGAYSRSCPNQLTPCDYSLVEAHSG